MRADRRGFTLVELIVVTVLGALIILAALQVLVTNQRTYTAQGAEIQGQQSLRAAMDVLWGELREVSAGGGDLLAMGPDSVRFRAMRKLGITCAVDTLNSSNPWVVAIRSGAWFEDQDSVFVFADNDADSENDDVWIPARITQVDTTETCQSLPAQRLTFQGQKSAFTADSVRVGAPLRSFVTYTYRVVDYGGETFLGRAVPNGGVIPLVGPLRDTAGVTFEYRDANGTVTTTATDVRQIVVTLRSGGEVINSVGGLVSDSISTWIYTRN